MQRKYDENISSNSDSTPQTVRLYLQLVTRTNVYFSLVCLKPTGSFYQLLDHKPIAS
jgi:hypothetical protein